MTDTPREFEPIVLRHFEQVEIAELLEVHECPHCNRTYTIPTAPRAPATAVIVRCKCRTKIMHGPAGVKTILP